MLYKMKKRLILGLAAAMIITLGAALGCFGCAHESHGTFYALENAYALNFITKEDLQAIAFYHNNAVAFPQTLPSATAKAIKETACDRLRGDEYGMANVSADGITIAEYYGVYNDHYAVIISDIYLSTPTDVPHYTQEIAGVEFCYTGYGIIEIWCLQSE